MNNAESQTGESIVSNLLAYQHVWEAPRFCKTLTATSLDSTRESVQKNTRAELETTAQSRLKHAVLAERFPQAPADSLSMWIADMDTQPHSAIATAIAQCANERYGYQTDTLQKSVSSWHGVPSENVIGVASVISAVDVALKTFCRSGDDVMIFNTTYGPLVDCIINNNLNVHRVPFKTDTNNGANRPGKDKSPIVDVSVLSQNATAFVLCHPNNPTGTVLSADLQAEIIQFCHENNITIITDEVHSEFGFVDEGSPGAIPLFGSGVDRRLQKNIVHINSASKAFNLAAIPGGSYAIIDDSERRKAFRAAITSRHLDASNLSQIALQAAYNNSKQWLGEVRSAIALNRKLVHLYFKEHHIKCSYTMGQAGYFLWLCLSDAHYALPAQKNSTVQTLRQDQTQDISLLFGRNDKSTVFKPASDFETCIKRGVIGSDGSLFNAPGFIRLNLACHPLQIIEALNRLFFV